MDILASQFKFQSLAVRDLLEAREHYHVHLLNKKNVVGTAVGLYLIRHAENWLSKDNPHEKFDSYSAEPRTLKNSSVRPYSWPCIIVFVDDWVVPDRLREKKMKPQDIVPKTLYMPDGRIVPVCLVQVEPVEIPGSPRTAPWIWPDTRIGGGFPVLSRHQGQTRFGSIGCLLSDGHTVFALSNRHVCGGFGEVLYSRLRNDEVAIGSTSELQLSRLPFNDVYPNYPRSHAYLNLDIGLIEIDDINDWTSRVYGLPPTGPLADLNEQNIGLQLIDQTVVGFGAASGLLEGQIKGLFYRYKSVGGVDYVADLLIAPQSAGSQTMPGDSGTIWHLRLPLPPETATPEQPFCYRPLAIEWGGQAFNNADPILNAGSASGADRPSMNFAVATHLSNVCKLLDVELITGHNTGLQPFWGAEGHYSIARYAIEKIANPKLKKLMQANADRISFNRNLLDAGDIGKSLDANAFVPLADVPDIVWKKVESKVDGGRDNGSDKPEHPTHYADVDRIGAEGLSLLDMANADPASVNVAAWQKYYDDIGHTEQRQRGMLPFRIWQFYDAMVGFAAKGDYFRFVAAAGICAHYVGDSCQPLHGSMYSNGYDEQFTTTTTSTGKPKKVWPGQGVHAAYEDKMIDENASALFDLIEKRLQLKGPAAPTLKSGHDVAVAIMRLMQTTQELLPPTALCNEYIRLGEGASRPVIDGLWKKFGKDTAVTMTNGIRMLAWIWEAAWIAGKGNKATSADLKTFTKGRFDTLYRRDDFVPSLDLDSIGDALK